MISLDRFPRWGSSAVFSTGEVGPLVQAHATTNTKGSYTSVVTIAPFDIFMLGVYTEGVAVSGQFTGMLVDIAIDPAGGTTYEVIVPNVLATNSPSTSGRVTWFPVFIPKGSQIAARCQASITSDLVRVGLQFLGGYNRSNPWPHRGPIQDYGTALATSGGTQPGATANANLKGPWAQVGADTTRRHSGLTLITSGSDGGSASATYLFDIGVDPAGGTSYTVVLGNIFHRQTNTEQGFKYPLHCALVGMDIPAGSSIAIRAQATAGNINDDVHGIVYAF